MGLQCVTTMDRWITVVALILIAASPATAAGAMRCWPGNTMQGGDLQGSGNMTVAQATSWCLNNTKCAGFVQSSSNGCTSTGGDLAVHFKDNWGAARVIIDPQSTVFLKAAPQPQTYICNSDQQCVPGAGYEDYRDPHCFGLCGGGGIA